MINMYRYIHKLDLDFSKLIIFTLFSCSQNLPCGSLASQTLPCDSEGQRFLHVSIFQAVARNIHPDEHEIVPPVLQEVLAMPATGLHQAVRVTATRLIGELGEWISKHPDTLQVSFIFLFLQLFSDGKNIVPQAEFKIDHFLNDLLKRAKTIMKQNYIFLTWIWFGLANAIYDY